MTQATINPYTQAILNCLEQFKDMETEPDLDEPTCQFLTNMIQGRFVKYLATRMAEFYEIDDQDLENKLMMTLMSILSNKFFSVFREKVNRNRNIVYKIAKRIVYSETQGEINPHASDRLYIWISRKYFDYMNFDIILKWISTNSEIEKIIFLSNINKKITNRSLIKALHYIIQSDDDGITPIIFGRYLFKNKIDRLNDIIRTGEWRLEAGDVQGRYAKLITWRQYMDKIT